MDVAEVRDVRVQARSEEVLREVRLPGEVPPDLEDKEAEEMLPRLQAHSRRGEIMLFCSCVLFTIYQTKLRSSCTSPKPGPVSSGKLLLDMGPGCSWPRPLAVDSRGRTQSSLRTTGSSSSSGLQYRHLLRRARVSAFDYDLLESFSLFLRHELNWVGFASPSFRQLCEELGLLL